MHSFFFFFLHLSNSVICVMCPRKYNENFSETLKDSEITIDASLMVYHAPKHITSDGT